MNLLKPIKTSTAFTLIELLVVIAVVAVLAGMLLPSTNCHPRNPNIACIVNLKQIGIGMSMYSSDNSGLSPWQRFQIPSDTNSARVVAAPSMAAWRYAERLNPYMGAPEGARLARVFRCPLDIERKAAEVNTNLVGNETLSYFVGFNETSYKSEIIVLGDRNLSPGKGQPFYSSRRNGPININASTAVWEVTKDNKFHENTGCLLFTDGHVEEVRTLPGVLTEAVKVGGNNANRFLFPQ